MQQRPQTKKTKRLPVQYAMAVVVSVLIVVIIGCFGTLDIGRVSVELRGAFPAKKQDNVSLPFSNPSTKASAFFTVTAEITSTMFSSGWLRIAPDDCITSIQVNSIDVAKVRDVEQSLRCWSNAYSTDLSPYLQSGPNKVQINLTDKGGRYGVDLTGLYSYPAIAVMVLCMGISLLSLYVLVCGLLAHPKMIVFQRYMAVVSMSLSGVLTLFFLQAVVERHWTWMPAHDHLASHLPQLSIEFLPIPFVFCLWLRIIEHDRPLSLRFSPLAGALTGAAFIITEEVAGVPALLQYSLATAIITGLFVLVPFGECLRRAMHNPRPIFVAIVAGSAACSYYWLMDTIWKQMCSWTTQGVYAILHVFAAQVHVVMGTSSFIIASPHYSIEIYPACNGLEGMFLFNFMLSVIILFDWELFKGYRLLLLYVVGISYMFVVNMLRISAILTLGYWANNPDAWEWVQSLKGGAHYLFHTYVGWVFYLVAFWLMAAWLYRKPGPNRML